MSRRCRGTSIGEDPESRRCDFPLASEDVSNLTFTDLVRLFLVVESAPLAAPRGFMNGIQRRGEIAGPGDRDGLLIHQSHLFLPHAFWEMPEVRHGFGGGRHPVRPASTHGEQPVAPRHHGRRHGRDHGSGDDEDAVTAFKA